MAENEHDAIRQRMQAEKRAKEGRYHQLNQTALKEQVLFAGSSLMEQFPIERFVQDYALPFRVYNRGIGGLIIPELESALEACVLELQPRRMFINIGTNDLTDPDITTEQVILDYEALLDRILAALPRLEIFLMAYYPVNPDAAPNEGMRRALQIRSNERINQANAMVREMARRRGFRYIDVNDTLKDEHGRLRAEYTVEGMHIRPEGYRTLMPALLPWITAPWEA